PERHASRGRDADHRRRQQQRQPERDDAGEQHGDARRHRRGRPGREGHRRRDSARLHLRRRQRHLPVRSSDRDRRRRRASPGGDETLAFSGTITIPTAPPIDPATNGLRVLLTDAAGAPIVDITLPAGASWRTTTSSWKYTDKTAALGITRALVRSSAKAPGL